MCTPSKEEVCKAMRTLQARCNMRDDLGEACSLALGLLQELSLEHNPALMRLVVNCVEDLEEAGIEFPTL